MIRLALTIPATVLSAYILLFAPLAHAQLTIPGAGSAVTISMDPAYPGPNTSVDLSIQSGLYDVSQGTVTWTVNGKIIAQGEGVTTAHIVTGAIGTVTQVTASVSANNGTASTAITIIPATVDLLWESNGYIPPFYKGKALPSDGSTVTVVAVPHFINSSGNAIAADQLTYTWKRDGAVIASASGSGKSSATFNSPMLFGSDTIVVDVASSDGSVSGEGTLRIADTAPQLILYEDDPLFGVLYHKALSKTTAVSETEMSFSVAPYFAPVRSVNDRQLGYAWTVNGTAVAINAAKPNEITINADRSAGIAAIALELTHATNYFFDAQDSWTVNFSNSAVNNGSGGAADVFHQ